MTITVCNLGSLYIRKKRQSYNVTNIIDTHKYVCIRALYFFKTRVDYRIRFFRFPFC